jgi:hypothetical protein
MRSGITAWLAFFLWALAIDAGAGQHGGHRGSAPRPPHIHPPQPPHPATPRALRGNPLGPSHGMPALAPGFSQPGPLHHSRNRAPRSGRARHKHSPGTSSSNPASTTASSRSTHPNAARVASPLGLGARTDSTAPHGTATGPGPDQTAANPLANPPGSTIRPGTPNPVAASGRVSILGTSPGTGAAPATANPVAGPGPATGLTTTTASTSTPLPTAGLPRGAHPTAYLLHGSGYPHYGGYRPYRYYGYGSRYYGMGGASMYFARMRRLARLINDLDTLTPGTTAPPSMSSRLQGDLMGIAYGPWRPPLPAVQRLSADLVSILPRRTIPLLNTGQLARDLELVMNANRAGGPQVWQAIQSAQAVLQTSGVSPPGIRTITSDLRSVLGP